MNVTKADVDAAFLTILSDFRSAVLGTETIIRDGREPERTVGEAAA